MIERRKNMRYPVSIKLSIVELYQQDNTGIQNLDSPIVVENISLSGLCFSTECVLPIDYYFNASLAFDQTDVPLVFTTVKILWVDVIDRTHYRYGCEFTNLSDDMKTIIEKYSTP